MSIIWQRAQEWELNWHGDCVNTLHEEEKQLVYAKRMGIELKPNSKTPYEIDLAGRSVIDVGGGPCSLLLKARSFSSAIVVDPLMYRFPEWVRARYAAHGVMVLGEPGESFVLPKVDEVWVYNVLQHVQNPKEVIRNAQRHAAMIRIFEWLDTWQNIGHPHVLTAAELDLWLQGTGRVERVNESGCYGMCYYGAFATE